MLRQGRIGHAGKIMGFEGPKPSIGHEGAVEKSTNRNAINLAIESDL